MASIQRPRCVFYGLVRVPLVKNLHYVVHDVSLVQLYFAGFLILLLHPVVYRFIIVVSDFFMRARTGPISGQVQIVVRSDYVCEHLGIRPCTRYFEESALHSNNIVVTA